MKDIIIVGGGPAGLTAAIYAKRNGKDVLVIEKSVFGGQITNSPKVENIPGFSSISGDEFADKMLDQAMEQGADVMLDAVTAAEKTADGFKVFTEGGEAIEAKTLILATGTTHRLLGLPGEEELIGNGISFCAVCDGDFYKDKQVVLIGGGNSAFVEANLLAGIVSKLVILQDMDHFTADAKLQEQLKTHTNVEYHTGVKVLDLEVEDGKLIGVCYTENGEERFSGCDGMFLAIGLVPENSAFTHLAQTDERGYFDAAEGCTTVTPGVFVAGDCRKKDLRQVTTACADGAQAAIAACEALSKM